MQGHPFKYFAYGVAAAEVEVDGFTGAYRTRRVDIVHDVGDSLSPLVDLGQIEGGFVQGAGWLTLEDLRWDDSDGPGRGRLATQAASTYKLPSFSEMPEEFNVALLEQRARGRRRLRLQGGRRAAADAGVLGARGAARRRPRRSGRPATSVDLAVAGHAGGGLLGARAARRRRARTATSPSGPARSSCPTSRPPTPSRCTRGPSSWPRRGGAGRELAGAVERCARAPAGVLVTVVAVRGHAPRDAGAKMVVSADAAWDTIGGGNLEATASPGPGRCSTRGAGAPETLTIVAQRQGADRARPAVLRRRGHAAARAAAGGARRGDLRARPRRARARPHPGPPRPRAAPRRLARRPARRRAAGRASPTPSRASTCTTPRCPSSCSAQVPARHARARHDPRPRRGRRALRRRAALRAPRLASGSSARRRSGAVRDALRVEGHDDGAHRAGSRRRSAARPRRQGPRHHRGQRRRRAASGSLAGRPRRRHGGRS